jgi:hypothetical protein
MRRTWRLTGICVLVLAMIIAPVAADDFTGSETEERELDCPGEGESVPANQSEPGPDDCPGESDDETYMGTVWTNQVTCNDGGVPVGPAANLYAVGDPDAMHGGVGVCNDGDTVPVKGRIVLQGSMDEGISAYADGSDGNSPDQLEGWARVDVDGSGPTVRCGADDGKRDATAPGPEDTSDNCG